MRLFTGIEMPGTVKKVLGDIQDSETGIRWTPPERLHLTLRFIGEVEEDIRRRLTILLKQIEIGRFQLNIRGIGYFPARKRPQIVWAGIEENPVLLNLQEQIENTCREVGLKAEDRPFVPHITIGRVQGASKKEVLSYINQHQRLGIDEIPVDKFTLYESRLNSEGAVHIPLQHFSLVASKRY